MKVFKYPQEGEWQELLKRPAKNSEALNATVDEVLREVRLRGDAAVLDYELRFDKVALTDTLVSEAEWDEAETLVPQELRDALVLAHRNIQTFHKAQVFEGLQCEVADGVTCWQRAIPIERVGLYVPGGTAPLFSTVLMLATPARIAGCKEIVLCTPPGRDGRVNPAMLVAARIAGVNRVYKVGGVQAIGAMAYGTERVPKVYKIFGPGNQYVMCAKQRVTLDGVAIDMPAGPSEVEVIADETASPAFVASDLLSQAEHGVDSQVLLVTTCEELVPQVLEEVERQLARLPRKDIAASALKHSKAVVLSKYCDVMKITNLYAPEHLIISTSNYRELAEQVVNAGSVFLGHLTPESAGDYASGTNHTLPTNGYAVAYSGVNLDSFLRKVTFQELTPEGVRAIGPAVMKMAEGESLDAHMRAMQLRYEALTKESEPLTSEDR